MQIGKVSRKISMAPYRLVVPCIICLFILSIALCNTALYAATSTEKGGLDMSINDGGDVALDNVDVVLLGASYAQGLGVIDLPGKVMVNKGIGGQQSFELLDRFQSDVLELRPGTVIIWGFINDIFRADPAKRPVAVSRIKESYQEMVRLSRENNITPILATEITMGPRGGFKERVLGIIGGMMGKTSYQERVNMYVMEVNGWLKEYASEEGLTVLDFQEILADEKGLKRRREYTQDDGSHVSEKGYLVLSQFILRNANIFR